MFLLSGQYYIIYQHFVVSHKPVTSFLLLLSLTQITWLEGHSLAQTVFTCLYVHNPDLIQDPALKAFALGILKICDIAREKVNKAAVFEEARHFCFSNCWINILLYYVLTISIVKYI